MFDIERTVRQRTDTTDTLTSQIALGSELALSIRKAPLRCNPIPDAGYECRHRTQAHNLGILFNPK